MSGNLVSRATLFALLLLTLAASFTLLTPKPAAAVTCPAGSFPATTIVYYTNANRTKISCTQDGCGGSDCTPTPYFRTFHVCCAA